jgi:hypothetical protein
MREQVGPSYGAQTLACNVEPKLFGLIGVLLPVSVSRMLITLVVEVRAV